jgi:tRNA threonylcarbamoyladenosine biosynthesis protein TsaE
LVEAVWHVGPACLGLSEALFDQEMPLPVHLSNAEETLALGRELGEAAGSGEVIALLGDLGAGKTTLTQGIVRALGYEQEVTSPTFSLVQEYRGGRLEIFHFDFYRVEEEHELLDLGWDDYLERGGVVIVEWPSLFPDLLPPGTKWIRLSHREEGRFAALSGPDCG